jgi:hypothetical protein
MISLVLAIVCSQNGEPPNRELQAAMVLGAKTAAVQRKLPVRRQVVLVPDEATYLDEISRWSVTERWPVLFNKEPKVSQFIRRFAPDKVWIRESVGKVGDLRSAMLQTVARAWGGDDTIASALADVSLPPLGVVITSPHDSARTAAVALAAGRGQLLAFMDNNWGPTHKMLSESKTTLLIDSVHKTLQTTGCTFSAIGDQVDVLTVCMSLPARVAFSAARENPVAVSDVIGRNNNGERFAWTGWIFGSKEDAAYMAMCSLFLQRDAYWFCNTYGNNKAWAMYGLGTTLEVIPKYGVHCTSIEGTLDSLRDANVGGVRADVMYFTSKGNQDFLDMSDERTSPTWLPLLDTPAALYFLHSWSLKIPTDRTSVGGTWLSRGVYAYVGSSHEPMLSGFVPQTEVMRRTMSLVPFLPASRWSVGETAYAKPWRINTIGDPLMLCPPKAAMVRQSKPAKNEPYRNIAQVAQSRMKSAAQEPSDEGFAKAIEAVVLLGKDGLACQLWSHAMERSVAKGATARAALGSLFRQEKTDAFLWAFRLLASPTDLEKDMLWHLAGTSPSTSIQLLIENVRSPYQADDIRVIADRIVLRKGSLAVRDLIDKALQNASGRNERELKRMRKNYGK